MSSELISFMKVILISMTSLLYCYFIAPKLPKGKFRLISFLPVFSLFLVLPLYVSSALLSSSFAFFITWLTTFKLVLFSFNLGPLAFDSKVSFTLFASIAFLPTRIKHNKTAKYVQNHDDLGNDPHPKLPLSLPAKVVIFAMLVMGKRHLEIMDPIANLYVNCATLYFYLDMTMSLSNVFVRSRFGVEVRQPFDEPYLATSLQNFWGRRWNRSVSETLHTAVYQPVRYEIGVPRWMAVVIVFVVSGLMHELLLYYIIRVIPTWEVTWFFVVHGLCVAVEIELKRALGKRWRIHSAVSRPLTIAFFVATVHWLFFPPLLRIKHFPSG
ncbi:probable long-chain-alcohol O-fatty-acyltransferase 5 [Cucurbita moschata]|uniref:Probable long-chain-alcohol O-fatty-acyltransferase 5 n=1 Tax=Cucurbita moschata TaxID=3662 RepID=A0A6J1FFF7_CUCMO|nr:probable long-chain-alcohol O-fatty-acyltransferase 5 [Cucurbita moschata]